MKKHCMRCGELKERRELRVHQNQDICTDCLGETDSSKMKVEDLEATLPSNYYSDEKDAPPDPEGIIPTRKK